MSSNSRGPRRLVLVGGGHAHLHVLRRLASVPLTDVRVTLVSPDSQCTYSGMVPGVIAGCYEIAEARVDLRVLCARAGVRLLVGRATGVDPRTRRVVCADGISQAYDCLSLDIGSRPAGADESAVRRFTVPIKPLGEAVERLTAFAADARRSRGPARVAVVGAGAGGVEVACAIMTGLAGVPGRQVTVIDRGPRPLGDYSLGVARRIERRLAARRIEYLGNAEVIGVDAGMLRLSAGRAVAADLIVWATGPTGLPLARDSGLPADTAGFLRVTDELRCVEYPEVFAAGDCARIDAYPQLPKAGVYAVRQGPILWHNLHAVVTGTGDIARYRPQRRFLSLVGTGDGSAVLSYDGLVFEGPWVWRLKQRIDRRWISKHAVRQCRERA